MKILKKGGGSREKGGRRKRNPCPMRLWLIIVYFPSLDISSIVPFILKQQIPSDLTRPI